MSKSFSPGTHETPLTALEDHDEFIMRHIGPRDEHVAKMLETIGVSSVEELFEDSVISFLGLL